MGDGRGHGGAGRTVVWGLSSPCGGVEGVLGPRGKERAGARVEVPRLDFLTKMKQKDT